MQEGSELKELIYKLAIYVPGVILGLSAKLSKLNKARKITWAEAIFQTAVALCTAWIAWFLLDYSGYEKLRAPAAVVCGRFGDEIMIWIWGYLKMSANTIFKQKK